MVITADIPFASEAIKIGAIVLNPRGDIYTKDSIKERMSMRSFLGDLRKSGVNTEFSSGLRDKGKKVFADNFDRELTKMLKRK